MGGSRVEKFERQIQRDLGEIFQQHSKEWFNGAFITISGIKASPDLGVVKVYLSLYNVPNRKEAFENIEIQNKNIRKALAYRIKNEVRKIPELTFYEDETLDYINHMDQLFDSIKKERENRTGEKE